LAEYNLRALRASIPPDITKRYEQRIQELKDIAAGEAALPVDAAPDSGKYAFLRYAPGAEDML
jgi:phage gp36-like protein